jgi:hypothetical protein
MVSDDHTAIQHCPNCPHEVKMYPPASGEYPVYFYFRVTHHETLYDLTYYIDDDNKCYYFVLYACSVVNDSVELTEIFDLSYPPNITPYNVMNKLPIILTFS